MAELIDRNAFRDHWNKNYRHQYANDTFLFAIANFPTVDAVIVVRCKDCKHWVPGDSFSGDSLDDMQRIGRCPIMRFGRREKDFCCEGERRTDG